MLKLPKTLKKCQFAAFLNRLNLRKVAKTLGSWPGTCYDIYKAGGTLAKMEVTIDDDILELVNVFLTQNGPGEAPPACSDGPLNCHALIRLLLNDVAAAVTRPMSWEGQYMRDVLRAHGYYI